MVDFFFVSGIVLQLAISAIFSQTLTFPELNICNTWATLSSFHVTFEVLLHSPSFDSETIDGAECI